MKMVRLNLDVYVDDKTAEELEDTETSKVLSSELSYFFEQRRAGGHIVTQYKLDEIVDSILETVEEEESMDIDTSIVEESVEKVIMKLVNNGVLTTQASAQSTQDILPANGVVYTDENNTAENESDFESNVINFPSEDSNEDVDEDLSQLADDMSDFFGW